MIKKIENTFSDFFAGKSPHTERRYRRAWADYQEWGGDLDPKAASAFIASLYRREMADASIRSAYAALTSIYQYLAETGHIEGNPFKAAARVISWRQRRPARPTATIDPRAILAVIEGCDSTARGLRCRAMLSILFGCGLRRSELCRLKISDVQVSRKKTLHLLIRQTKGGKQRQQPIPAWVEEHVSAYIVDRIGKAAEGNDYLFDSRYGERSGPVSGRTVAREFRKHFDGAPHAARAAFATRLLDQGFSYEQVADALGHGSTHQVRVYDHRERSVDTNCGKLVEY
jgi:integrase/recombinase XerC